MNESLYSVEHDKCMLPIKKLSNMKYELIRLSELLYLYLFILTTGISTPVRPKTCYLCNIKLENELWRGKLLNDASYLLTLSAYSQIFQIEIHSILRIIIQQLISLSCIDMICKIIIDLVFYVKRILIMIMNNTGTFKNVQVNVNFSQVFAKEF